MEPISSQDSSSVIVTFAFVLCKSCLPMKGCQTEGIKQSLLKGLATLSIDV